MTPLSIAALVLLVLWFTLGIVPIPGVLGGLRDFPRRYPWLWGAVAAVFLAITVAFHSLRW